MVKKIGRIIQMCVTILLIIIGVITIASFINVGSFRFFIVNSGSMEPTIKAGSILLSQKTKTIKEGDIITFFYPLNDVKHVTHRVNKIEKTEGENDIVYRTKGDANNTVDTGFVRPEAVYGKLVVTIPFLGYFFSFLRTTIGLMIFIIIPATIIVYNEILSVIKEIKSIMRKRKEEKTEKEK